MAETTTAKPPARAPAGIDKKKPAQSKPEDDSYKGRLAKAEKDHADILAKLAVVKTKLDNATPNSKDSPAAKRRAELLPQLKEIRDEQATSKGGRTKVFTEIKKLEEQIKSRIAEQKTARSRTTFKSTDEIDREIEKLDKQVNGGMMKLVDEKKALSEISALRKQRKGFAGFEEGQKEIDKLKADLKTLRDSLDDPKAKAMSERYNEIQTELDAIKKEQDEAYKGINALRDERTRLNNEQQEKWQVMKKVKDDHFNSMRAARERQKVEREKFEAEKRKERAQKMLDEASDKAYMDEIRRAEGLLRFLDPSYAVEKAPLQAPSQFQAQATRTVDESGLKGTKVLKKEDREEDYFAGTGGKKGKKGRKGGAVPATGDGAATGKYNCPPSVMEDCAAMGIDPPMSAADIPSVSEKVKAKLDHWKADQGAQTERNIAKARKEVERLEAEEIAAASAAKDAHTATNGTGNGLGHGETKATASVDDGGSVKNELALDEAAEKDARKELEKVKLDDKA